MKAYSLDLRQKVLAAALRGDRTTREMAELFGVGTSISEVLLRELLLGYNPPLMLS